MATSCLSWCDLQLLDMTAYTLTATAGNWSLDFVENQEPRPQGEESAEEDQVWRNTAMTHDLGRLGMLNIGPVPSHPPLSQS